jgi:hypothetical protein
LYANNFGILLSSLSGTLHAGWVLCLSKSSNIRIEQELRKYELALMHGGFWRKSAKVPRLTFDIPHWSKISIRRVFL